MMIKKLIIIICFLLLPYSASAATEYLYPETPDDVSLNDWTSTGANKWSVIDDAQPLGSGADTDYVKTAGLGDENDGALQDSGITPAALLGTYYFDSSDASPTDPEGVWTNDSNMFNGTDASYATVGITGSETLNELNGEGTNAPSSGDTISNVRIRAYGYVTDVPDVVKFRVFTDGKVNNLGRIQRETTTAGWSDWFQLAVPSLGWDWATVQALELVVYGVVEAAGTLYAGKAEIAVYGESPINWVKYHFRAEESGGEIVRAGISDGSSGDTGDVQSGTFADHTSAELATNLGGTPWSTADLDDLRWYVTGVKQGSDQSVEWRMSQFYIEVDYTPSAPPPARRIIMIQ